LSAAGTGVSANTLFVFPYEVKLDVALSAAGTGVSANTLFVFPYEVKLDVALSAAGAGVSANTLFVFPYEVKLDVDFWRHNCFTRREFLPKKTLIKLFARY